VNFDAVFAGLFLIDYTRSPCGKMALYDKLAQEDNFAPIYSK